MPPTLLLRTMADAEREEKEKQGEIGDWDDVELQLGLDEEQEELAVVEDNVADSAALAGAGPAIAKAGPAAAAGPPAVACKACAGAHRPHTCPARSDGRVGDARRANGPKGDRGPQQRAATGPAGLALAGLAGLSGATAELATGLGETGSCAPSPARAVDEPLPSVDWAQCQAPGCGKWRRLPATVVAAHLPEVFECFMGHWMVVPSCATSEERWSDESSEEEAGGEGQEEEEEEEQPAARRPAKRKRGQASAAQPGSRPPPQPGARWNTRKCENI